MFIHCAKNGVNKQANIHTHTHSGAQTHVRSLLKMSFSVPMALILYINPFMCYCFSPKYRKVLFARNNNMKRAELSRMMSVCENEHMCVSECKSELQMRSLQRKLRYPYHIRCRYLYVCILLFLSIFDELIFPF